jgi:hypothetical protein
VAKPAEKAREASRAPLPKPRCSMLSASRSQLAVPCGPTSLDVLTRISERTNPG